MLLIFKQQFGQDPLYSNMTVLLCIRQGSKINDDSVSVEELDWSPENQVLIPAEDFWCDFKYRPWAKKFITKHQWLVHSLYGHKYWDTPFFRREKALPNCGNKDGNTIQVLKKKCSTSFATVLKCMKWLYPYVIGVWWWMFGSRSAFKVTREVFSWD